MKSKRIQRIDSFFDVVADHLTFSLVNPKNQAKARALFFKNTMKSPSFTYGKVDTALEGLKDMLEEITFGNEPIEQLFEQKRKELILKSQLLIHLGTPKFAKITKQIYPAPNEKLVEQAYAILKLSPSKPAKKILRKEALQLFRKIILEFGLKYKIRSVDMTTSARMDATHRLLELKKEKDSQ